MATDLGENKLVVNSTWSILHLLDSRFFADEFEAIDIRNGSKVFVKITRQYVSRLILEKDILNTLNNLTDTRNYVPTVLHFGHHRDNLGQRYWALVTNFFCRSPVSLEHYAFGTHACVMAVLKFGINALGSLERIHDRNIIHRDIRPKNLGVMLSDTMVHIYSFPGNWVPLLNFENAKRFRNRQGSYLRNSTLNFEDVQDKGTAEFCARQMHHSMYLSRANDLESLGYSMIYMIKGKLPWSKDVQRFSPDDNSYDGLEETATDLIVRMKEGYNEHLNEHEHLNELCVNLPHAFKKYFQNIHALGHHERPDYRRFQAILGRDLPK